MITYRKSDELILKIDQYKLHMILLCILINFLQTMSKAMNEVGLRW